MKRKLNIATAACIGAFTLSMLSSNIVLAQGNSENAPGRAKSADIIDHTIKCHPQKDVCGRLTKRQRDMELALCDLWMRRGTAEIKASLGKKLKGKSCEQHFNALTTVD